MSLARRGILAHPPTVIKIIIQSYEQEFNNGNQASLSDYGSRTLPRDSKWQRAWKSLEHQRFYLDNLVPN